MRKQTITFTVNGTPAEAAVEPRKSLADCLRQELELTGTHVGCEHGVCGACTVIVNGQAIRSCLLFAVQADGADVLTVEGLAHNGQLHPLQQAFWEHFALQCGFCTPGFLLTAYDFLISTNRSTGKRGYELLKQALRRLQGVTITTNIVTGGVRIHKGFGLIEWGEIIEK